MGIRRQQGIVSACRQNRRRAVGVPGHRMRFCLEGLESRLLLAVDPVISEFAALNSNGRVDRYGDRSDWIEIHNPSGSPLDLSGYYLTDRADDLTQWAFPAVTVQPGGYLVVAASSRDQRDPAMELHTSFELSGSGEYLALVAPDGQTIISEYAPEFPQQLPDVSYGRLITRTSTPLIPANATAKVFVPTDGLLTPAIWTSPDFDDSAWLSGTTGIGYDLNAVTPPPPPPGFGVRMIDTNGGQDGSIDSLAEAISLLDGTTPPGAFEIAYDNLNSPASYQVINFGSDGSYGSDQSLPNGARPTDSTDSPLRQQYVIRATASLFIPAGTWTIAVGSDDGFMLRIPGIQFTRKIDEDSSGMPQPSGPDTLVYSGLRGHDHTLGTFTVPSGGLHTSLLLDYYEREGGDDLELCVASGSRETFRASRFSLLSDGMPAGWMVKASSILPPPNYSELIHTDVQAQMHGRHTSALVRLPFSAPTPGDFETLRLRVKYDDGFVAYINGREVARRHAPAGEPAWDAAATIDRPVSAGLVYEVIDIPVTPGLLLQGDNVLAIQALNDRADSPDFLIQAELEGAMTTAGAPRYFQVPTPGEVNSSAGLAEAVADTKFDHDRGFYDAPFGLTITCQTPGAQIRYTTDGSAPTATSGLVYDGPITIDRTSTIRAAAFKPGAIASNIDTQTYLFIDDVITQSPSGQRPNSHWPNPGTLSGTGQVINYGMDPTLVNNPVFTDDLRKGLTDIPTFSVVMNLKDLFDPSTGFYANPEGDGRVWERMASIELIYPNGEEGFQIDGGVRVRGGYSRSTGNPKHGLHFFFRDEPGYGGKLQFPMFGPDGAEEFERFDLRCGQNYSWSFEGDSRYIAVRDQFNRDLQEAMGQPTARGDYYHLYINGQYWGLYNTEERPSASNAAELYGGSEADYDVIKVDPDLGYNVEAVDGNMSAWIDLWNQVRGDMSSQANYMRVQGRNPDGTRNPNYPELLDVDNLIDYMLIIFYGGNLDAPLSNFLGNTSPNNFYAIRSRNGTSGGFKFYIHDAEHTLLNVSEDRTGPFGGVTSAYKANPQSIFELLCKNPEFRLRVADRIHKHFFNDGVLTPASATALFAARQSELYYAIVAESARWGDSRREPPLTRNDWLKEMGRILNGNGNPSAAYLANRGNIVFTQLQRDGLYSRVAAPEFNQHGGPISNTFSLSISNPGGLGTIYYTLDGSDPRLVGGGISAAAIICNGALSLSDTITVNARIRLDDGTWSALTQADFTLNWSELRPTELMYSPAPPPEGSAYTADDFEFIELQNTGSRPVDLTGLRFTTGIDFAFPALILAPGQRTLIVSNLAAFESRYGTGLPIAGVFANGTHLSNTDGQLTLSAPDDQPIFTLQYSHTWYPITDGGGFSLVMIDPEDPQPKLDDQDTWRPSHLPGGAPGGADPGLARRAVSINEIMARTDQPTGDWIELYNSTDADIDLGGWYLSDDADNLAKYLIPASTIIPAGGYLVFSQAEHFGKPSIAGNIPFDLDEAGGYVYLTNSDGSGHAGGYRQSQDFDACQMEVSLGRYIKSTGARDFIALSAPTPGMANALPLVGPVVINEIMYNPADGRSEYVELKNLTGADIRLDNADDLSRPWMLSEGVEFAFPAGAVIPAFGYVLLVPTDPDAFRSLYDIPAEANIYGPYSGKLENNGEDVTLSCPGEAGGYVRIDRVRYNNKSPWPASPDGKGPSLSKANSATYGNDPINWQAGPSAGTPGRINGQELPALQIGGDAVIQAGESFTRTGFFADGNLDQTWTATVNWGDKSPTQDLPFDPLTKTFTLSRDYAQPGTYPITVTVRDSAGGIETRRIVLTVLPGERQGTDETDFYTLRLDSTGTSIQFFENVATTSSPTFSIRYSAIPSITINGNGGNDTVRVDFSYGNPIPSGGLRFNGGDDDDILKLDFAAGNSLAAANVAFDGGSGSDRLWLVGSAAADSFILGNNQLHFGNLTAAVVEAQGIQVDGGKGDDTLTISEQTPLFPFFYGGTGIRNTLIVQAGIHQLGQDALDGEGRIDLVAEGSAVLNCTARQYPASLTVKDQASVILAPGGNHPLLTYGLAIRDQGILDLADNDLVVSADESSRNEMLLSISQWIKTGRNGGRWNGRGILSSAAAADARRLRGLAVVLNETADGNPIVTDMHGQWLDTNAVIAKYTWQGDVDINGVVDADDFALIDRGYLTNRGGYRNGDLDFTGRVDADDYFLVDRAFLGQAGSLVSGLPAAQIQRQNVKTDWW